MYVFCIQSIQFCYRIGTVAFRARNYSITPGHYVHMSDHCTCQSDNLLEHIWQSQPEIAIQGFVRIALVGALVRVLVSNSEHRQNKTLLYLCSEQEVWINGSVKKYKLLHVCTLNVRSQLAESKQLSEVLSLFSLSVCLCFD